MSNASRMPAVFLGHGNPMNALERNAFTQAWAALGAALPRPRAVLCVSAHWYGAGTAVTANRAPRTIHDFGGFPRELFDVQYPAPGASELAQEVVELLKPVPAALDADWGLDHGAWSVLVHVYPAADVPVVQLRIDATRPARWHFDLARRLAPLRDSGVLILGSGNLVHNLRLYAWNREEVPPFDWALRFEAKSRELLLARDFEPLIGYESLGSDAMLSAPTPDHYLPLLYVLAQHREAEAIGFPVEGFEGGSISMLAVQVG